VVNYATYGIASSGANIVILSTFGYRYSDDGGSTWNDATGDPASPTEGELVSFDGALYANTGSDLLRSQDDGATWSSFTVGIGAIDIASLEEFVPAGTRLHITALFDIYYIDGIGTDVSTVSHPLEAEFHPNPAREGTVLEVPPGAHRLDLLDASGRMVRTYAVRGGRFTLQRDVLRSGPYRAIVVDQHGSALAGATVVFE
jgi:hypothetical protein